MGEAGLAGVVEGYALPLPEQRRLGSQGRREARFQRLNLCGLCFTKVPKVIWKRPRFQHR